MSLIFVVFITTSSKNRRHFDRSTTSLTAHPLTYIHFNKKYAYFLIFPLFCLTMKVYLSSTLHDLGPERQAVKEALSGECAVVESYTADERNLRDSCLADVARCNLYIGIVGRCYGFIPPGQSRSITELEYQRALECKLPTLVFVKDDRVILSKFHDAVTNENPPERIESFRQCVSIGTEAVARAAIFKDSGGSKVACPEGLHVFFQRYGKSSPKRVEGRPYPGLRAFLPTESDRFFGRDAEIESLVEHVLVRNKRFHDA